MTALALSPQEILSAFNAALAGDDPESLAGLFAADAQLLFANRALCRPSSTATARSRWTISISGSRSCMAVLHPFSRTRSLILRLLSR